MTAEPEAIIFFDGVCNLCNASVQRVLKNDTRRYFSMASLQSPFARRFFEEQGFNEQPDSIILFMHGRFYVYSDAVLMIAGKLRMPYPLLRAFTVFPRWMRDPVYRYIARHRYRWFGKRASCMIPDPSVKDRFLDER